MSYSPTRGARAGRQTEAHRPAPIVAYASDHLRGSAFPLFTVWGGVEYQADRKVFDYSGEDLVAVVYVPVDSLGAELHILND